MKILAINTSPRPGMSTAFMLKKALEAAVDKDSRLSYELLELGGLDIRYCRNCDACEKELRCAIDDDFNEKVLPALADSEVSGILIGTPVYTGTMCGLCKNFLDRASMLRRHGFMWRDKVGAVISVGGARSGGQDLAIQAVQSALLIHDMSVVCYSSYGVDSSSPWREREGAIHEDAIGIKYVRQVGERLAQVTALQCRARIGV